MFTKFSKAVLRSFLLVVLTYCLNEQKRSKSSQIGRLLDKNLMKTRKGIVVWRLIVIAKFLNNSSFQKKRIIQYSLYTLLHWEAIVIWRLIITVQNSYQSHFSKRRVVQVNCKQQKLIFLPELIILYHWKWWRRHLKYLTLKQQYTFWYPLSYKCANWSVNYVYTYFSRLCFFFVCLFVCFLFWKGFFFNSGKCQNML